MSIVLPMGDGAAGDDGSHRTPSEPFSSSLVDASRTEVLQASPDAQKGSIRVWHILSSPGTIPLGDGLGEDRDRLRDGAW